MVKFRRSAGGPANFRNADTSQTTMETNMPQFGWYFMGVGLFGLVTAFARAKHEREIFLLLATIPTAFLVIRCAEFLRKRNKG